MRLLKKKNQKKQTQNGKRIKNEKGQMIIEAVLIMALLLLAFRLLYNTVFGENFAEQLVQRPFQRLSGVIENGVYGTPDQTRGAHPNHQRRQLSYLGDAGGS